MCLACIESFQSFAKFIEKSKANIRKLQNIYKTSFCEVKTDDSPRYNSDDEEFSKSFENNHTIREDESLKCEHCNKDSAKCHCVESKENENSPKVSIVQIDFRHHYT